ncbi:MAG: hypothetical protein ACOCVC_04830 [Spirochaeta sp.]
MSDTQAVAIYHIYRNDGSSLFLHPFDSDEKVLEIIGQRPIQGIYGRQPHADAIHGLRSALYDRIDAAVGRHVRERLFIPKFLLASVVFMISFFFMSLIILTPIPVLDEFIISSIAAVLAYTGLGRMQNSSERANRLRMKLRSAIDEVRFSESACVIKIEALLARIESALPEKILHEIPDMALEVPDDCSSVAMDIAACIRTRLPHMSKIEYLQDSLQNASPGAKEVIYQRLVRYKIDIPLFALAQVLNAGSFVSEGLQ